MSSLIQRFRDLHASDTFVMPNPYDIGSARLLQALGFPALASTSAGFAATLGQLDMTIDRDQLVAHIASITAAVDLPLNVDAERCYSESVEGIAETVHLLAAAGAAGFSIEDWNPMLGAIDGQDVGTARVATAVEAARPSGMVVTARCENHLHGLNDLDDTLTRLRAYVDAGAGVVYAPGLSRPEDIARVVAIGAPVNVLLLPGKLTVTQLADLGVRRISVGSLLSNAAQGALVVAATSLLHDGMFDPATPFLNSALRDTAFRG